MFFGAGALITLAIYLGFPTAEGYQFGLHRAVVGIAICLSVAIQKTLPRFNSRQGPSELEEGMVGQRVDFVSGFDESSKGRGLLSSEVPIGKRGVISVIELVNPL